MNIRLPLLNTRSQLSGAALVVTLAILVLLLGLTIGLFLTANSELRSASLYKNSQGVRELADTSVNLVQAQIKDATLENATAAPGSRSTWASQPGMIRTYGSGTNATRSYKLYSWSDLRVSGDDTTTVPTNWSSNPALYTDLNEPVPDSEAPSDTSKYRYPIAYPPASGTNAPLGYSVTNAPIATGGAFTNSVPMPVQWLYVLGNGVIASGNATATNQVTVSGASSTNPIVGRIAFWTDDETCKVNLNTAAGGPFWMTPYYATTTSTGLNSGDKFAHFQPMAFEFQRYAGHPARTDLRAVFPDLLLTDPTTDPGSLYAFAPRIQFGGSMAAMDEGINSANNTIAVTMDSDRILASSGEARFDAIASATGIREEFPAPALNTGTATLSWSERNEQNKFLTTVSSRSPEITLYGTPRISIWPEATTASKRTPFDDLIAFCATLPSSSSATNTYYFDRNTIGNSSMYATNDIGRSRNKALLGYLDALMKTSAIPGSGSGGFSAKADAQDLAQVQTQIFDYVRCTNLLDSDSYSNEINFCSSFTGRFMVAPSVRTITSGQASRGFGRAFTLNQFGLIFGATADFAEPTSNVVENKSLQSAPPLPPPAPTNATLLTTNQTRVMALPVFELANPSAGFPVNMNPRTRVNVRGLDGISVTSNGTTATGLLPANWTMNDDIDLQTDLGSFADYPAVIRDPYASPPRNVKFRKLRAVNGFTNGSNDDYPVSRGFTVSSDASMNVSSSTPIYVDVVTISSTNTITIPPFSVTVNPPKLNSANVYSSTTKNAANTHSREVAWSFHDESIGIPAFVPKNITSVTNTIPIAGRSSYIMLNQPSLGLIYPGDSVVALAAKGGDYRLSLVNPGGGSANYEVVPGLPGGHGGHRFYSPNVSQTNSISASDIPLLNIESNIMGLPGLKPVASADPYLPTPYPSGVVKPLDWGDFDNGQGMLRDGPYINKPNEGVVYGTTGGGFSAAIVPYFRGFQVGIETGGTVYTTNKSVWASPNREVASPVAFGSLPSAPLKGRPWQNLLFRPAPTAHPGSSGQRWDGGAGADGPADHYLLDYFWMPVVEPWALSERFSTAGKLNLNYMIAPFSYIKRETPIHALLYTEVIPAVPSDSSSWTGGNYEKINGSSAARVQPSNAVVIERECNIPETIKAIEVVRGANKLFSSPTQICDVPLIPKGVNNALTGGPTFANISSFWAENKMTGDNLRELPYNNIYPRLTIRSNTFTVHYRVQVLKKLPGGDQGVWDETKDKAVSELRGSTLIERYLDPNAIYPDYATTFSTAPSLEASYRFRVLQRSDFTP